MVNTDYHLGSNWTPVGRMRVKGEIKQPAIKHNTMFFKYAAVALLSPYIIFPIMAAGRNNLLPSSCSRSFV